MIECILDGMEASSHKVVNLLKLDEVTQGPDKNPAMFLNRLTEALVQYTRLSRVPHWGSYLGQSFYLPILT